VPEQLESTWSDIRDELRREAPDFKFHIWLAPLELAAVDRHRLFVRAPEHIRTGVEERYLPLLVRAARARFHQSAAVEIVGEDWQAPTAAPPASPVAARSRRDSRLNPKYSFDQFVIGGGNRFAHAAALAVAELPAQAYNPLFVHGPPGLGKTHLLHAIGNYVTQFGSGLRVCCATVEEFTSEFVEAVRERRTPAFKDRFRSADVVLIDDVQFLARKERTREEFFHMFNALQESGRQLVMTSDRSPDELSELEARLSERFQCGLVVPLEAPEFDVRRAILAKRARHDDVEVSGDVLDESARCVTSSVRALEGALIRVVAYASLRDETATPALARRVLHRLGGRDTHHASSISEIVDATATEFGLDPAQIVARDRRPKVAEARQVAMYLARELTEHSLPEIGRGIGGRNHTTVHHAISRISLAIGQDSDVRQAVDKLRSQLGGGPALRPE
jgi:chromosomal replication initiator protein